MNLKNKLEFSPSISSPNIKESIELTKKLVNSMKDKVEKFFPSHDVSEHGIDFDQVVKFAQ